MWYCWFLYIIVARLYWFILVLVQCRSVARCPFLIVIGTSKQFIFAEEFSAVNLSFEFQLFKYWSSCSFHSCSFVQIQAISSRYLSYKNNSCRVLANIFFSRTTIKIVEYVGTNFVPITVPNLWWYVPLPSFTLTWEF